MHSKDESDEDKYSFYCFINHLDKTLEDLHSKKMLDISDILGEE